MPAAYTLAPTIHSYPIKTVNLGTKAQVYSREEIGKAVKLIAPDTYGLCAAGDQIEGIITSSEYALTGAKRGGLAIGGISDNGYFEVVASVQLAINDFVVAGAQPAFGTKLADVGVGAVPALPVQKEAAGDEAKPFRARIVGLGRLGTGAPGTICMAEFI